MPIPTLVLDTNVVVSSLRSSLGASHRLVNLVGRGVFDTGITAALVLEYEEVCKRMVGTVLEREDVDRFVDYVCRFGKRSEIHFQLRPSLTDPDDEMVLEAAVASGSKWIVTHNIRDFAAGAPRFGVEPMTPREALQRLGIVR